MIGEINILDLVKKAKDASRILANLPTATKNELLLKMAEAIEKESLFILDENKKDISFARESGLSDVLLDRLELNEKRINAMIQGLKDISRLPDPIGETTISRQPNGLMVGKMRVPLGVIGIIYEARPNVTADSAGLCLKAGNAVILRGGKEAINSNLAIAAILQSAIASVGLPGSIVSLIKTTDREAVRELVKLKEYVDVIILRGGHSLIEVIGNESAVPIIAHGEGNCHLYVDNTAELSMAEKITLNAKVQRPGVCNAIETLLVHQDIAPNFLSAMIKRLIEAGVEIRGCSETKKILSGTEIKEATEDDWKK